MAIGPDRVQPAVYEDASKGGDAADAGLFGNSNPINPTEDAIEHCGEYFNEVGVQDQTVFLYRDGGVIYGVDNVNTTPVPFLQSAGGGITEPQHEALDTLAHDLVEDSFQDHTYVGGRLTNTTIWTDSGMTTKIREYQLTYTGSRVTTYVEIQYDGAGVELYRLTDTITYSGNRVDTIATVRTP